MDENKQNWYALYQLSIEGVLQALRDAQLAQIANRDDWETQAAEDLENYISECNLCAIAIA